MRKVLLLVLAFNTLIFNAQESQEVAASKWKDGLYEYYYPKNFGSLTQWVLFEIKHKLVIKKTNKGKISKISLTGNPSIGDYIHLDSISTQFVRHYTNTNSEYSKLYFNENCIIAYRVKLLIPKPEIDFEYCIGKKPDEGIKDEILAYLESTKNYFVPKTIYYTKDIESITPVIISGSDELASGAYIKIGLIFKTKGGIEVKSKNLGGKIDIENFLILSNQLEYDKTKSAYKIDCKKLENKELEISVHSNSEPNLKFITKTPVKCDSENSPTVLQSKILSEYDFVKYRTYEGGKDITKTLKKLPETGYSTYPSDLMQIYLIKNIETSLIQVQKNDKIGYITKNGKLIIPIEYDNGTVNNFKDKVIGVKKNGKWGYINFQNKVVTDFIYDLVYTESNGASVVKKDNKYGYVDVVGKQFVNTIYDDVENFSDNGLGIVVLNGKRGCIDKTGKLLVATEFEKSPKQLNATLFAVYKNGKYGVIKTDGNMLFDFKYDEIYPTGYEYRTDGSKGYSNVIRVKLDDKYGYIKGDGKVLSECIFTEAGDVGTVGLTMVKLYENKTTKGGDFDIKTGKVHWTSEVKDPEEVVSKGSNTGGKNSSKSGSDKKTVKNTGKGILHMGADGSTGYSVNGGGTVEFSCSKKVYYTFYQNGGYNGRGPVISEAKQDCGQTINANGDSYNKK